LENSINPIYRKLLEKIKDSIVLGTVQGVIHWDMETMMPPNAVEQRSLQLELLSRIGHQMSTSREIGDLLQQIQSNIMYSRLNAVEKRNIYLINKSYIEQNSLSEKLVAEMAKQETITVTTWKRAKVKKDFNLVKSELKKLLELNLQAAEILMDVKQTKTPYEALIDQFEPKMTTQKITELFDKLQIGLQPFLERVQDSSKQLCAKSLHQPISVETQRLISQFLTQTLGYDTVSSVAKGRIDETEHPFTSGSYQDVRITTHYYVDDFINSVFSVLHETGHALYELNVNPEWRYQPVGGTCSYGIHESQSRFYENVIGRSKEFLTWLLPNLQKIAPVLSSVCLDDFVCDVNQVKRSKIRIQSDEVTYNLHIIIRYELERDLFEGKVCVDELPQVWNEKYAKYLGVEVEDNSEGVLQDTHWYSGLYGYFPSYALGNIYSGQIVDALTTSLPSWCNQLSQGNLSEINNWLKVNVHQSSSFYDPEDLVEKVTGKKLDPTFFLQYLDRKYRKLDF